MSCWILAVALAALAPEPTPGGPEIIPTSGGPEIIYLKGGAKIEAVALKESGETVFVDLGFTVLGIPAGEILQREAKAEGPAAPEGAPRADLDYVVGTGRADRSVRELSDELGSSVVLVTTPTGTGSGFFINTRGEVITNAHVIEHERKIGLTIFQRRANGFDKKRVSKVDIVALNPYYDLALLRVDPEELKGIHFSVAPLAPAELRTGDTVFAIGNPLGLERTVTEGIVSTTSRALEGQLYLQTTAEINPGNSGGPLFNLRGEVVGVTSMGYMMADGLGFAIPVRRVREFVENREAFTFDADNPNTGYRYLPPVNAGAVEK